MQTTVPHFVTGDFTSHRKFLADKEYGDALDSIVKGCTDMLIVSADGAKLLLGKRLVHPQPDWWFVGGRMMPGDTPKSSCARLLRRELGLEVQPERLSFVCSASLAWAMREQAPQTNGTTDVQLVLSMQATQEEMAAIKLDEKEYSDSQWIAPQDVLAGDYHPALKHACGALLAGRVMAELERTAAAPPSPESDAQLAKLARELVALRSPPPAGVSSYRVRCAELSYDGAVNVTL